MHRDKSAIAIMGYAVLLGGVLLSGCCASDPARLRHSGLGIDVSPSGRSIVFPAAGVTSDDLYLLDLVEHHVTRLVVTPEEERTPRFTPDGKSVVYVAQKPDEDNTHLYVCDLDGNRLQLTRGNVNDCEPSVSPDGEYVVFIRDISRKENLLLGRPWRDDGAVWIVKMNGGDARAITEIRKGMKSVCFAPDGTNVVFSDIGGTFVTSILGASIPKRVFQVKAVDVTSFRENGTDYLAYVKGDFSGQFSIYVVDLLTRDERRITNGDGGCFCPRYVPSWRGGVFLRETWMCGGFGPPKRDLWRFQMDGSGSKKLFGYCLFDDPVHAQEKPSAKPTRR